MQALERDHHRLLAQERQRQERRTAAAREQEAALLQQMRGEVELRMALQRYEQEALAQRQAELACWDEVDYAYIQHYMGKEAADRVRAMDAERRAREKAEEEARKAAAIEMQRRALVLKLRAARNQFFQDLRQEGQEMEHFLEISQAYVYSYFTLGTDSPPVVV